jgi:hypothetical protein
MVTTIIKRILSVIMSVLNGFLVFAIINKNFGSDEVIAYTQVISISFLFAIVFQILLQSSLLSRSGISYLNIIVFVCSGILIYVIHECQFIFLIGYLFVVSSIFITNSLLYTYSSGKLASYDILRFLLIGFLVIDIYLYLIAGIILNLIIIVLWLDLSLTRYVEKRNLINYSLIVLLTYSFTHLDQLSISYLPDSASVVESLLTLKFVALFRTMARKISEVSMDLFSLANQVIVVASALILALLFILASRSYIEIFTGVALSLDSFFYTTIVIVMGALLFSPYWLRMSIGKNVKILVYHDSMQLCVFVVMPILVYYIQIWGVTLSYLISLLVSIVFVVYSKKSLAYE